MRDLWLALSFRLFGWHQYRVRFDYMRGGRVVFSFTTTVGVEDPKSIDNHRFIKRARGPITNVKGLPRHLLCNGEINMEPTCYLGRWK